MQCLENIKHDKEASPKCNSILLQANLSFCQGRRLWGYFFALRTALSLLQVSAQSFKSLFESERVEGWPGQCEHVGYPKGQQQLFLCPCQGSTSSRQRDGAGLGPVPWPRGSFLPPDTCDSFWLLLLVCCNQKVHI